MSKSQVSVFVLALLAVGSEAGAQSIQRRAAISGGSSDRGQCVIEVVVDGEADVEIRGDQGVLRNLSGQPPEFRRFECTSRIPLNVRDVRMQTQEGRGHIQLLQGEGNGASAVVRITDPEGGAGRYVFTLEWAGGGPGYGQPGQPGYNQPGNTGYGQPSYGQPGYQQRERGRGAFGADQAMRICQDAVRDQARAQLNSTNILFDQVNPQDNPGGRDRISGIFYLGRDRDRDQAFQFDCAVNFESGRVMSVHIDRARGGQYSPGVDGARRDVYTRCESRVRERLLNQGYRDVQIGYVHLEEGAGPNDRVSGTVRAFRGNREIGYTFSCIVEARDGDIRSVEVNPR